MRFFSTFGIFYVGALVGVFAAGTKVSISWLILSLFLLILEVGHPGLFLFLSFSLAAAVTSLGALLTDSFVYHTGIFFLSAGIFFKFLKTYVYFVQKNAPPTNIYGLIGQKGIITIAVNSPQCAGALQISPQCGQVKIKGQLWLAQSLGSHSIEKGAVVYIKRVEGTRLIVSEGR